MKRETLHCWAWILGTMVVLAAGTETFAQQKEHPLAPAIRIATTSSETAGKLTDYTAVFSKTELVGRKVISASMRAKFRAEPFSVYLGFLPPNQGREVIYVAGRNEGKLLAHESGIKAIAGTVALLPTSKRALSESRYPITNFGVKKMVDLVIEQWKAESRYGEVNVKYYPNAKLGNMQCKVIESSHPQPRREFKYHLTRVYIDKATNLPVRVEQYAFPRQQGGKPVLVEQYTYSNIQPNVGLRDADFDTRNPNYKF